MTPADTAETVGVSGVTPPGTLGSVGISVKLHRTQQGVFKSVL